MSRKRNRKKRQQQQRSSSSPPESNTVPPPLITASPAQPAPPVQEIVKTASQALYEGHDCRKKEFNCHNLIEMLFTGAIAIATVVQVAVSYYQWSTMREQNSELVRQTQVTQGQLAEMTKQTDTMEKQLTLATDQLIQTKDATRAAIDAADAAKLAAKVATEANRIASDTAKKQLRAYITVHNITATPEANGRVVLRVNGKNTGQSPAHDVVIVTGTSINDVPFSGRSLVEKLPDMKNGVSKSVTGPGGDIIQERILGLDPPIQSAIMNGTKVLSCYGVVVYKDIFDEPHQTTFLCTIGGDPNGGGFNRSVFSEVGNEAN